jgi:hypothetical protein
MADAAPIQFIRNVCRCFDMESATMKVRISIILFALSAVFIRPAAAQEEEKTPGQFFLSLSAQVLPLHGDLDKGLVLWHFDKAFVVPTSRESRIR